MSSTHSLRKKFVKGYNLPIHVLQSPYFEHLLDLYEPDFSTRTKYNEFKKVLEQYNTNEEFFQDHDRVLNEVIDYISRIGGYEDFKELDLSTLHKPDASKYNVYQQENDGKFFISIDFKEANFNIMKLFGIIPERIENWHQFISHFTDNEFFKKSKHLRQMIFGHLNPKRQQRIQLHYLSHLIERIKECTSAKPTILGSDEVIIPSSHLSTTEYDNMIQYINDCYFPSLNFSLFQVKLLSKQGNVYVKNEYLESGGKKQEIKNCPAYFLPQYYKYLKNIRINDNDLVFYHDGKLAKFLEVNQDLQ